MVVVLSVRMRMVMSMFVRVIVIVPVVTFAVHMAMQDLAIGLNGGTPGMARCRARTLCGQLFA